jgi:hypothetical protein
MFHRNLAEHLHQAAQQYAALAVIGPRQSGKTTLVQEVFPQHRYISLEDLDIRALATSDPRGFLQQHSNTHGIILDEIQRVPDLLSYIQTIIDKEKKKGYFIITGSQNLLINQAITQTLAGRIALFTLFPLSINELKQADILPDTIEELIFKGCYPRIYDEQLSPVKLYEDYIRTYIERDVRQLKNIFDLALFQKFIQLCAGRIGQLLNIASLSNDCGIDTKTARAWLSLLEATYIIFLLQPYHVNFGKRLTKSPKLYFVDTGIACSLLNIKNTTELTQHYLRGNLVESCIIADLFKQYYHSAQKPSLSFWRDHTGNEIDCIIEQALSLIPIEIKAGKTVTQDYFKAFTYLKTITKIPTTNNWVIYGGTDHQTWPQADVIGWQESGTLLNTILKGE